MSSIIDLIEETMRIISVVIFVLISILETLDSVWEDFWQHTSVASWLQHDYELHKTKNSQLPELLIEQDYVEVDRKQTVYARSGFIFCIVKSRTQDSLVSPP